MSISSVLVIDDEPINFDVIQAALNGQNYVLNFVGDSQEAIASLDIFQPDVILLDIMMPDMDGIELCQRIKAMPQWQSVPIIMVTALATKEDLARSIEAGADDFISKPVSVIELRARVKSMLRIKQQYDNLQLLLELREDMVKMVVHDLRNPLTNILLGLDILELLNISPEKKQAKISQIRLSGQYLQSLINDLILFAKIESGKVQLKRTKTDLSALIKSVFLEHEGISNQKEIELVSHLPKPNSIIDVDVDMFHRVLDNLLSNAIKFSPTQSKIVISLDYPVSGGARIQVADLGEAVPDILRQKIFEKYEIGTLMKDISQIGLGLAFCKMVVEAHGGKIGVKSNQPRGSIFEIILPNNTIP